ncbi:Tryptophan--tRNA ligase, mitochondrial [Collariella sp. IMI 366227]|nr:Tryptophan--tRNA ligase, mitochondrial [Collariella sp. IMI 366227]
MNAPRLLRPLRPLFQGQLPLTAPRSAAVGIPRASTQLRTYAAVEEPTTAKKSSPSPPADAAPTSETKPSKPTPSEPELPTAKVTRMPRSLEALYLQPLRREAEYGVPSCDLQLRSYSIRNLEFFCDFALRAAYYLGLPAYGPVPLPRITQRWTVPKSTFIFKKSQENFARTTLRRLIQIRDGNPESVQLWLAFLQKHSYYGIGMKANVWEFSKLGVGKEMDKNVEQTEKLLEDKWEHLVYMEKKTKPGREQLPPAEDLEAYLTAERRKLFDGTGVVFSAIQSTGVPHLGNYLGALREWKRLQDTLPAHAKLIFAIADLHSITVPRPGPELYQHRMETMAALLAIGLNPKRCTIFFQSAVPAHSELQWILSCTASMGYLSRMTQWKSKLQLSPDALIDSKETTKVLKHGLFSYPILQAADILLYRATHVPVGEDQRQHLEFSRECATNFNHTYQTKCLKMSKSDPAPKSRILISDTDQTIRKKIRTAVTDAQDHVSYDPAARPGVSNLLDILSALDAQGRTPGQLAEEMKGFKISGLKEELVTVLCKELGPIRERWVEYTQGRDRLSAGGLRRGGGGGEGGREGDDEEVAEAVGLGC